MSEESKKNKYILIENGASFVAIVVLLIACMHYGYSCSACGCMLVDSKVSGAQ